MLYCIFPFLVSILHTDSTNNLHILISVAHTSAANAYSPYPTYNTGTAALSGLSNSYAGQHMNSSVLQNHAAAAAQRTAIYSDAVAVQSPVAASSLSSTNGLYTQTQRPSLSQSGMMIGMPAFHNWSATSLLPSASSVSIPTLPSSRHTTSNTAPLHSPLTAQVYSIDSSHMRPHSGGSLDVGDSTYTLRQHSPDHLLPECAATEPGESWLFNLDLWLYLNTNNVNWPLSGQKLPTASFWSPAKI